MLGVNKGKVKLVAYSPKWKELFVEEKEMLESIIGENIKDIQHFGSTAIEGINAKPIIDILVGVESLNEVEKFDKERLKESGYYHLRRVRLEGKVVFAKFSNLENLTKTHIMHIVEHNGTWWKEHTSFRDYLNENPEKAREYETLKKRLALKYPNDERLYTDEKKKFVDGILSKL
ncbi:GrpB family protein [Halalkalibacterium halodurans]|uniref:GrpB family protein n=1 Tax=Halalkalibacterium halodurans TaxID=86665 RepID=A0A0M0KHW1_ALKHA|nr:GrpB family protein [Halalkalibacterium halodurans]TPE68621.1 GrpB family protein [Halalkalibacterium halodurans]